MRLSHVATLYSSKAWKQVTCLAFSPNGMRLVAATADRSLHFFDDKGKRRDKFSTRPAQPKGPKNYILTACVFSPDSSKLAVAQTDGVVYVFRVGLAWGDPKSIATRFPMAAPAMDIIWPASNPAVLVAGLANGDVVLCNTQRGTAETLYSHTAAVTHVSLSPDATTVVSGHADGAIITHSMTPDAAAAPNVLHRLPGAPTMVQWARGSIIAATLDGTAIVLNPRTSVVSGSFPGTPVLCGAVSPSGTAAVLGCPARYRVLALGSGASAAWTEMAHREDQDVPASAGFVAAAWSADGAKLALGSPDASVDLLAVSVRRVRRCGHTIRYVSGSHVTVTSDETGEAWELHSTRATAGVEADIRDVQIVKRRFLIAPTSADTVLVRDTLTGSGGEFPLRCTGAERYITSTPGVLLVAAAGEVTAVRIAGARVLGSVRTAFAAPALLSLRVGAMSDVDVEQTEGTPRDTPAVSTTTLLPLPGLGQGLAGDDRPRRLIAHLSDPNVLAIADLTLGGTVLSVRHSARIDWLEINTAGSRILFRDRIGRLYLAAVPAPDVTVAAPAPALLLSRCGYAQWVPDSDVVVAQSADLQLHVWYSLGAAAPGASIVDGASATTSSSFEVPPPVTSAPLGGEVVNLLREGDSTEAVVAMPDGTHAAFALDGALIAFGAHMSAGDLPTALKTLLSFPTARSSRAMHERLAAAAIAADQPAIASACYGSLGNVPMATHLFDLARLAPNDALRKAEMGLLAGMKPQRAASLLVQSGRMREAVDLHCDLGNHVAGLALARTGGVPERQAQMLAAAHRSRLLSAGLHVEAAALLEADRDFSGAVRLYLDGGAPHLAARCVLAVPGAVPESVVQEISAAMLVAGRHRQAGEFLEKRGDPLAALSAYKQAGAWRQAVALARIHAPQDVVGLERLWARALVASGAHDEAVAHFAEAGDLASALGSAITAQQWSSARRLLEGQDAAAIRPQVLAAARQLAEAGRPDEAEEWFRRAGDIMGAVAAYIEAGKPEAAVRIAGDLPRSAAGSAGVRQLVLTAADGYATRGRRTAAEELLLAFNFVDEAIAVHSRNAAWEDTLRLVRERRPQRLTDTLVHAAARCEEAADLRAAERYYCEAGEWQAAASMYRTRDRHEDALRVAEKNGGAAAVRQAAFLWAQAVGSDQGAALLAQRGLLPGAVDYGCDIGAFDFVGALASSAGDSVAATSVHCRQASALAEEGHFDEAEALYLRAGRAQDAVEMHLQARRWREAENIATAENLGTAVLHSVWIAHAEHEASSGRPAAAEPLFIQAGCATDAIAAYQSAGDFESALRVAKQHATAADVRAVGAAYAAAAGAGASAGNALEQSGDYSGAIFAFLGRAGRTSESAADRIAALEAAVRVARAHDTSQLPTVARRAAVILGPTSEGGLARPDVAAELLRRAGLYSEALKTCLEGAAACGQAPLTSLAMQIVHEGSLGARAEADIAAAERSHFMTSGDANALAAAGAVQDAIAVHLRSGDYARARAVATQEAAASGAAAAEALLAHIAEYELPYRLDQGDLPGAIGCLTAGPLSPLKALPPSAGPILDSLIHSFLSAVFTEPEYAALPPSGDSTPSVPSPSHLQRVVARLSPATLAAIDPALRSACLLAACALGFTQLGFAHLAARAFTALLRHSSFIPQDRLLVLAGEAWRQAGRQDYALALLNRYVDVSEALDEYVAAGGPASGTDGSSLVDASEVVGTDIPWDAPLPPAHFLPQERRAAIRDWVLAVSLDGETEMVLPMRDCPSCGNETYAPASSCSQCGHQALPVCALTGWPLASSAQRVTCSSCGIVADREAWVAATTQTRCCPQCGASAL
jgi:intraflagellar transport protein 172